MSGLTKKQCVPCRGDVPALDVDTLTRLMNELGGSWKLIDGHHLENDYRFTDFRTALEFVNRIGELAENEGHHPDVYLAWGKVKLMIWTHKIDGLTESDFILAAKADRLYRAE